MGVSQRKTEINSPGASRKVSQDPKKLREARFLTEVKGAFFGWQINFLENIIEEIPFPTITLDHSLKAVAANKLATNSAAQASRKIIGRSAQSLAHEWLASRDIPLFLDCLNDDSVLDKEQPNQHKLLFSNLTPVCLTIKKIRGDQDKKILYFIISIKEIRTEKDGETHYNLLGTVSHELKTPLTAIKAFGQLANRSIADKDERASQYLQKINDEINRITNLVDDVFDVSRIYLNKFKINKEENSLDEILSESIEEIKLAKKTHQIVVNGQISEKAMVDRNRIKQVFLNILNNAIKYSPQANKIEVNLSKNNLAAQIAIHDYGQGINHNDLENIFEKFYQGRISKKTNLGLGLGLYLSQKIIKGHGGNILVSSQKNKGSVFTIVLPFK